MKKNKAFTLIEILAVVTIIGLIFILVIPKITTSLKNKKSDVDTTTTNLVLSATKLYVSDHLSKFEKTDGNVSCMPLRELVDKGYLDGPVKNVTDDKDITNGKSVRITYDKGFKYELVDIGECSVAYNPPCDYDYCDSDGNGYIKLEYVETTGEQYIDLGVKGTQDSMVDVKFEPTQILPSRGILGAYSNNSYYIYSSGSRKFQIGYNTWKDTNINMATKVYNVTNVKNIFKINEDTYTSSNQDNFETSSNLLLFTINDYSGLPMKLYYFKLYEGDKLIRDLVPVVDKKFEICLFDIVEKKCYYNDGKGDFITSAQDLEKIYNQISEEYLEKNYNKIVDRDNKKYYIVNYIKSTGTQYIDLGVKGNHNSRVDFRFKPIQITTDRGIFGAYGGSSYYLYLSGTRLFQIGYKDYKNSSIELNTIIYDISSEKNVFKINEDTYTSSNQDSFETSSNLLLFTIGGGNYLGVPMKLYYFKLYDNDTLVRYLIPVVDTSKIPCMFDNVEKKCYYNQGTGEFLWG